jgi:hypothetical protein
VTGRAARSTSIGNFAGVVGSVMLVGIAAGVAERPIFLASLVYSACLLTMLGCSTVYNLASNASRRGYLRQLDHAAIFLMIAGTYIHDMPIARRLGDRDDRRGLDGSNHRSRHKAELSTWYQARFDLCLPGPGLDDPARSLSE